MCVRNLPDRLYPSVWIFRTVSKSTILFNYIQLADVKEKNEELREHLEETKDELYQYRNKDRPQALRHNYLSSSIHSLGGGESLASELERSLGSEIDYPRGYSPMERR